MMPSEYIEERNGATLCPGRVAGTCASLDSAVCAFRQSDSPERILARYPALDKPSKVYGAIAFYLDHQADIDADVEAGRVEFEATPGAPLSQTNQDVWARLELARSKAEV